VLPWAGFSSAVSYTFDDSQPSQIEHFPALAATGVRMTFYVNSSGKSQAGYVATWQEAIALGHEIGNHTVNHCHADLADCSGALETLDREIDDCSSYIVNELGQPSVWTFAYPFGDTGYQSSASSRFLLSRGVASGTVAPSGSTSPHELPVIPAAGGESAAVFNRHIDTANEQGRWLIFLFHSILPTAQNWYAGVEIASITDSIEHAKQLERVWIDSVVEIGTYWLGQRALEAATPTTANGTTTWTWELPALFPPGRVLRVAVDGGTLSQDGESLAWDGHGYYEVALDAGALTWTP
jgi:peptidoglycan/xylan/chitin deacetylase (PgdA/CDA1 family)